MPPRNDPNTGFPIGPMPTNHAEALDCLQIILTSVQKCRSDLRESSGDDLIALRVLEQTRPWLFGPRCPITKLSEIIARATQGAPIAGSDLHHFLWITEQEPIIGVVAQMWQGRPLPQADMSLMPIVFEA